MPATNVSTGHTFDFHYFTLTLAAYITSLSLLSPKSAHLLSPAVHPRLRLSSDHATPLNFISYTGNRLLFAYLFLLLIRLPQYCVYDIHVCV